MAETIPLSVVIPTYNRSGFVRECLVGLEKSGVPNLEVIVVDDGSTDDTADVVARTNPRAIYITQKNSGPAAARNRGFQASRGRYVGFLDCDDHWLPDAPARAIAMLDRHPEIDVLFAEARMGNRDDGYVSWIDSAGQTEFFQLPHRAAEDGLRILEPGPLLHRMAVRNPVFIGAVILKREAFERAGAFDTELCGAADWNLWLRMAATMTIAYWHEPLAIYTKHLDGMSNDHDGMSKEFCMTLRKLPAQVTLMQADRQFVAQRLRHHLFSHAYRAYNRGDFAEARQRFSDLLLYSGWEWRGFCYRVLCGLPFGMPIWLRRMKQWLVWTSREPAGTPEMAPRSKAVLPH